MDLQAVVTILSGSAFAVVLAKAFLSKSLRELDDVVKAMGEFKTELAKVSVKLDSFEVLRQLVTRLDRKVAALDAMNKKRKLNGSAYDDEDC